MPIDQDFLAYCRGATDAQLREIYRKEVEAGRDDDVKAALVARRAAASTWRSDMGANDLPNMDRTAEAIREHDRVAERVLAIVGGDCTRQEIEERLAELTAAEAAVGEAFALDTADRNSADNAKLVRPNGSDGWVRRLLHEAGYEGVAPPEEQRRRRGWGW